MIHKASLIIFISILGFLWPECFDQNMKDHLWENRILLIKTDDAKAKKHTAKFRELLQLENQQKDRKLVVYAINGTHFSTIDYVTNTKDSRIISTEEKDQLFQINTHF